MTVSINVVVEAWSRGWSDEQIAFACGVSRQRIAQRISRYEDINGAIVRRERKRTVAAKFFWRCAQCKVGTWSTRTRLTNNELHFCSNKCFANYQRCMTDEEIEQAIYLRWEHNSWKHIIGMLGRSQQVIQVNIWKYLYATGQLDLDMVASVWTVDSKSKKFGWRWLELNTGIHCTEHGAERGERYDNRMPWGSLMTRQPDPAVMDGNAS